MDDWKLEPARDLGLTECERFRSHLRESGLVESALRYLWWSSLGCLFRVWNRLTVSGREHLPKEPPFLLIANHASHLDALVLATLLPLRYRDQLFPLAARDVFFERDLVAGFAATLLNALPLRRGVIGSQTVIDLRRRLAEDRGIFLLFPEGTRSRTGELNPFRSGVGMLIAGLPVPVVPCYLAGTLAALPPGQRVPGPARIHVRIGPPCSFADLPSERAGWDQIAATLSTAVMKLRDEKT